MKRAMKERSDETTTVKSEFIQNKSNLDSAKDETMKTMSAINKGNQIISEKKEIFPTLTPTVMGIPFSIKDLFSII